MGYVLPVVAELSRPRWVGRSACNTSTNPGLVFGTMITAVIMEIANHAQPSLVNI